jgi:cytidine deaminase
LLNQVLGQYVRNRDLSQRERELVDAAFDASTRAWQHFPVGAAVLAHDAKGRSKIFAGANVENKYFSSILCAEHNAATTAVADGYTVFTHTAVLCSKKPGGNPCGICRQVFRQYASDDAVVLILVDEERNVRRALVADLLPVPPGTRVKFENLSAFEQDIVLRVLALKPDSYAPYSHELRSAIAVATDATGNQSQFRGIQVDNASYPASLSAERVAIGSACTEGFRRIELLAVTSNCCSDSNINPIDGDSLQVLREFGGMSAAVMLVGDDRSVLRTSIAELLPDSFGPDDLG